MPETKPDTTAAPKCEELHCLEMGTSCPSYEWGATEGFAEGREAGDSLVAAAFREVGPADERWLDWHRSDVEPWRTIARKLDR